MSARMRAMPEQRACVNPPESRLAGALALALAVSTRAVWGSHVALRREAIARSVHLLAEVRLRGLVVLLARGLALELVVVLEGHDVVEVDGAG